MSVSPQLQLTSANGQVRGRLFSVEYWPTDTVPPKALLRLEVTTKTGRAFVNLLTPIEQIRRILVPAGILGEESIQQLLNKQALSDSVQKNLEQYSNVRIIGFSSDRRGAITPKVNSTQTIEVQSIALDVTTSPKEKTEYDRNQNLKEPGIPAQYNIPEEDPPFTPILPNYTERDRNRGWLRIGWTKFNCCVIDVSHNRNTKIETASSLRDDIAAKKSTGFSYETYTVTYVVQGGEEIASGVRDVVKQLAVMPFITMDGSPFGDDIPHKAFAVRSFTIQTLDQTPQALTVTLQLDPFLWFYYLPHTQDGKTVNEMDSFICWPLAKIWTNTRQKSKFNGQEMTGNLSLSYPDVQFSEILNKIINTPERKEAEPTDLFTLNSIQDKILPNKNDGFISPNVKEIVGFTQSPNKSRLLAIKLESSQSWNHFVNKAGGINPEIIGLIDWSRLELHTYVNSDGSFAQSGTEVNLQYIQQLGGEDSLKSTLVDGSQVAMLDVVFGEGTLNTQIDTLIDNRINQLNPTAYNYQELRSRLEVERQERKERPWEFFSLVVSLNPQTTRAFQKQSSILNRKLTSQMSVDFESHTNTLDSLFVPSAYAPGLEIDGATSDSVVVQKVTLTKQHNISLKSHQTIPLPLHEHTGSMDVMGVIQGVCNPDGKALLEAIKEEFDARAQNKISRKLVTEGKESSRYKELGEGFLRVKNEIFDLMGVNFVMPLNIEFHSMDGMPGWWEFSLSVIEYDPKQVIREQIQFLPTTVSRYAKTLQDSSVTQWLSGDDGPNPIIYQAEEFLSLQAALKKIELYPDLSLPSANEFRIWVSTCKIVAEKWIQQNKGKKTLNNLSNKRTYSKYEEFILSQIVEWFEAGYAEEFLKWTNFYVSSFSQISTAQFVNPDFFIYYNPEDTWIRTLDDVSKGLMGGADSRNKATGQTEGSPPSYLRLFDSHHGDIYHISDNFYASRREDVQNLMQDLHDNAYSPNDAQKVKDAWKKAEEDHDADPIVSQYRWWKPNSNIQTVVSSAPGDEKYVVLDSVKANFLSRGILNQNTPNFQSNYQGVTSGEQQEDEALQTFDILDWRQQITKKVISKALQEPLTRNIKISNRPNSFFSISGIPDSVKTVSDLEAFILRSAVNPDTEIDKAAFTRNTLGSKYNTSISVKEHYLSQTFVLNQNWKSVQNGAQSVGGYSPGQSPEENVSNSFRFIDPLAWKLSADSYIDPHIIRAFFLRRDGLGAYNPQDSVRDYGPGDLSADYLQGTANYTEAVSKIGDTYRKWLKQFGNIPSFALLLTNMESTSTGRAKYLDQQGNIHKDVLDYLAVQANKLTLNRFSPKSVSVIQETLANYPEMGKQVDEYFTSYISLNRVYGSYSPPTEKSSLSYSDPFFFPFSGLILTDVGNDSDNAYLQLAFTPTGRNTLIDLSRNNISSTLAAIKKYDSNFNPNSAGLERQILLSSKLGVALSPHDENAIYSMMHDLRNQSTFGKLLGAFPTYQVLLINEGFMFANGPQKLWDHYYTRQGVSRIEVYRSWLKAAAHCNIVYSNMFYYINAYSQMEALMHSLAVANRKLSAPLITDGKGGNKLNLANPLAILRASITKTVDEFTAKAWENNHLKQIALGVGTRLHVRMGYGSDCSKLPIVFNGNVVEAPNSEGFTSLIAVGDGYELMKPTTTSLVQVGDSFAYSNGGILGFGKDPSAIISEAMVGSTIGESLAGGFFRDFSKGIQHFGHTYFTGGRHYPADCQINIYSSNPSELEQGIPMVESNFMFTALYNYKNMNLFSVEVKEPSIWKVMQVCQNACMDYVASAEWFGLRSTVFFGKWWWPYHYEYDSSILDLRYQKDFLGGVSDKVKVITNAQTINGQETPIILQESKEKGKLSKTEIEEILTKARTYYPAAPPIALEDPGGDFYIVTYDDGAWGYYNKDLKAMDSSHGYPQPSRDNRVAYEKATVKNLLYQEGLADMYPEVKPKTAFEEKASHIRDEANMLLDVNTLTQYCKWKTYSQIHVAYSTLNLLENNITPDSELVYTDAIGTYKYNGVIGPDTLNRTIMYSVDSDINPTDRKVMTVDTGLVVTMFQGGIGKSVAEGLLTPFKWVPTFVGEAVNMTYNYIHETPSTPAVNNAVVNQLSNSVKQMYRGSLVLAGNTSIKPRDIVLLNDHRLDMKGPVMVRDVVHSFDEENGLMTVIGPGCMAYPHTSQVGHHLLSSLVIGAPARAAGYFAFKGTVGFALANWFNIQKNKRLVMLDDYSSRYRLLLDEAGYTSFEQEAILSKYKARIKSELSEQLKAVSSLEDEKERLKLTTAISAQQNDLNALNDINDISAFAEKHHLPSFSPDDVESAIGQSHGLRQKLLETERKLQSIWESDVETAKRLFPGEDPIKIADAKRDASRATWYKLHETDLIELEFEITDNRGILTKGSEYEKFLSNSEIEAFKQHRVTRNQLQKELSLLQEAETLNAQQIEEVVLNRTQGLRQQLVEAEKITNEVQRAEKIGEIEKALKEQELLIRNSDSLKAWAIDLKSAKISESERKLRRIVQNFKVTRAELNSIIIRGGRAGQFFARNRAPLAQRYTDFLFGGVKGLLEVPSDLTRYRTFLSGEEAIRAPRGLTKARATLRGIWEFTRAPLGEKVITTAEGGMKTAKAIGAIGKDVFKGASIAAYAGPQAIVKVLIDVAFLSIGSSVVAGINSRWAARQVLKVFPLMVGKLPLVAGLRGHQGAVVGDDPGWFDKLTYDWSAGANSGNNWFALGLMATTGIEIPEDPSDPADEEFIRLLQENHAGSAK